MLNIEFPVIMAPMFLVSNEEMTIEAIIKDTVGPSLCFTNKYTK